MCFAPTKDKTTLFTMFFFSRNPKIEPKQRYLRCFCNSEKGVFGEWRKTQINIRMAKIQKRCILRCFFPFRCENFCFEKRSKHRNLQCFLLPPRTKHRYLRCFPPLATPKKSRNIGIYDVFAISKKTSVAKTSLFAWLLQHHICKMLYFTVFLNHLFKNTGIYGVLKKLLA